MALHLGRLTSVAVAAIAAVSCSSASLEVSDERGMTEDRNVGDGALAVARADLEVMASKEDLGGGVHRLTVGIRSLDNTTVDAPIATFELIDGVSVEGSLPSGCELSTQRVECVGEGIFAGSLPTPFREFELSVQTDESVANPSVVVTATSTLSPLSNDPNPENNTIDIEL